MLLGIIITIIYVVCTLSSFAGGNASAAGGAVMEGAVQAVSFCVELCGGICLWSAVMEVMEQCGIASALARLMRPVLRRLFPVSTAHGDIFEALSENVSANLLGLGNAATPAGIRAAQGMARLGEPTVDELCLLVVINSASIQLLPTTVAAVRAGCGAAAPFDIIPAVWFSSLASELVGILTAALLRRLWR